MPRSRARGTARHRPDRGRTVRPTSQGTVVLGRSRDPMPALWGRAAIGAPRHLVFRNVDPEGGPLASTFSRSLWPTACRAKATSRRHGRSRRSGPSTLPELVRPRRLGAPVVGRPVLRQGRGREGRRARSASWTWAICPRSTASRRPRPGRRPDRDKPLDRWKMETEDAPILRLPVAAQEAAPAPRVRDLGRLRRGPGRPEHRRRDLDHQPAARGGRR